MAELLGVVTGSAGLASLGIQILESTRRLYDFCSCVRGAPSEIRSHLEEIEFLASIIINFSSIPAVKNEDNALDVNQIHADSLRQCYSACQYLKSILADLDVGMRSRPRTFSILAALKAPKFDKLLRRLERAKSALMLTQLYLLRQQQMRFETHQDGKRGQSSTRSIPKKSDLVPTSHRKFFGRSLDHRAEYNLGVCSVRVLNRNTPSTSSNSDGIEHEIQLRFAPWLKMWGVSFIMSQDRGIFRAVLQPQRLVPDNSPLMRACALGDHEEVTRLISTKEASSRGSTHNDVTPLHVAAAWLRPETCKVLLEMGADSTLVVRHGKIQWTPLQLAGERAGCYRPFLFAGLEDLRPLPGDRKTQMRETMRILLQHGNADVNFGYVANEDRQWNGSRSVLHFFRGTSEDYSWLVRQKELENTKEESDDYKASIVLQQTQMFPNDSFNAALCQITDMSHLGRFSNIRGLTALHYLLSSNWGPEPGIWLNGLDVFPIIESLLRNGADPCATNISRMTPLMHAARHSLHFVSEFEIQLDPCDVSKAYEQFLGRWIEVLRSCGIDLATYHLREQELGASEFFPCVEPTDKCHPLVCDWLWFVKATFQVTEQNPGDMQLMFEYRRDPQVAAIPGAWVHNAVDAHNACASQ